VLSPSSDACSRTTDDSLRLPRTSPIPESAQAAVAPSTAAAEGGDGGGCTEKLPDVKSKTETAKEEAAAAAEKAAAEEVEVVGLLEAAYGGWYTDTLQLAALTGGKPLSTLGPYLFQRLGLVEAFEMDFPTLCRFFVEVRTIVRMPAPPRRQDGGKKGDCRASLSRHTRRRRRRRQCVPFTPHMHAFRRSRMRTTTTISTTTRPTPPTCSSKPMPFCCTAVSRPRSARPNCACADRMSDER